MAGFGGVVLLSVNHRRQKVAEGDHRLALRQEEREKSKLLNERFAAAAEQLAHESEQVRLADSSVVLADVFLERGQIVVTDLTLRGGLLRIRPVEPASFVMVRRIDVQDGEVDVPERAWKGRAPEGTPRPSERDGHGGVGHDGADVREEL